MTSQPSTTNFYWVCKKMWSLALSLWKMTPFQLTNFYQLLPLIGSIGNITCLNSISDFERGACNTQWPSNPNKSLEAVWLLEWPLLRTFFLYIIFNNVMMKKWIVYNNLFFIIWDCSFQKCFFFVWTVNYRCKTIKWGPLNLFSIKLWGTEIL